MLITQLKIKLLFINTRILSILNKLIETDKIFKMKNITEKIIVFTGMFLLLFQAFGYGQGSTYTGSYTPSAPISWNGISNQTISKLQITNPSGHCISLTNCSNITIQYCSLGPAKNEGVNLSNCTNITIINCTFSKIETGLYACLSSGISFTNNDVQNVQGPYPKGQMCQFDKVSGAGNSISYNVAENVSGQSNPEDCISLYMTNGTAASPVQVNNNWIRGGGPSNSGGGIMTGDDGGSYISVQNNILVNPGQYGIAVASGTNINVSNNKIYSASFPFSNVGLYVWNEYATPCSSITCMNNQINFYSKYGTINNTYSPGNCGTVTGWSTNTYPTTLNASILPSRIISRVSGTTTAVVAPTIDLGTEFKVYPNPASDHITIESSSELNNGKVIVYNIKGQRIIEQAVLPGNMDIDTRALAKGVYLLKISGSNHKTEDKKIIIGNALK